LNPARKAAAPSADMPVTFDRSIAASSDTPHSLQSLP
jgi:hypothetical protein